MRGDVALLDAKCLGHQFAAIDRQRAGGPHLQLAVFPVRRGALRLKRDVGNERILVSGLDDLGRRLERGVHVAVLAQRVCGRRREQSSARLL